MSAAPTRSDVRDDLVTANRILFHYGIVDGFGHISVREEDAGATYLMARYVAPGLVERTDLRSFDFESRPLEDGERHYSERFIHGEIYKARPDVRSVIHCHAPPLLPFGVTRAPLRPIYHMSAFLAGGVPVFEIRDEAGMTDLLIRTPERAAALARVLGTGPAALMRGHGATFVGDSIRQVVYRAIYATQNAISQMEAMRLGEVTYLAPEEAAEMERHARDILNRPWEIWKREAVGYGSRAGVDAGGP